MTNFCRVCFFFSSGRRHTRGALVTEFRRVLFRSGEDTYTVTAYFPRAVSVFESSDVRVLGLPAGKVTDVVVDGDRVRIDMEIPEDVPVPADAGAQIVPQIGRASWRGRVSPDV